MEYIYKALESTEAGADIVRRAKIHGLPNTVFGNLPKTTRAEYGSMSHSLILNTDFRTLPPELAAPSLAHELNHRIRRWYSPSLSDEVFAHKAQSRVWAELRGRFLVGNMPSHAARDVMGNELILNLVGRGDNALLQHLKGIKSYSKYPLRSARLYLDPDYLQVVIPFKGQ